MIMTTLSVDGPALVAALKSLKRITANSRLSGVPILSAVIFRNDGDRVLAIATDLDAELAISLPGARLTGALVLPLDPLLAGLDGEIGTVRAVTRKTGPDDHVADITVGDFTFTLTAYSYADFPSTLMAGAKPQGATVYMAASDLHAAMTAVSAAVSTEETRYYLNGIYVHASPDPSYSKGLAMTSTDGHRLMHATFPAIEWRGPGLILPRVSISYLMPMLKAERANTVRLSAHGETRLVFAGDDWTLSTKVIDGTFPDYTRMIPKDHPHRFTVGCDALTAACKKLGKLSSEQARAVAMDPGKGIVRMAGADRVKEASVAVPMALRSGEPPVIGFNSTYVTSIVAHMGETVTLAMGGTGDPALFTPTAQPDSFDLLAVLMPMRV